MNCLVLPNTEHLLYVKITHLHKVYYLFTPFPKGKLSFLVCIVKSLSLLLLYIDYL